MNMVWHRHEREDLHWESIFEVEPGFSDAHTHQAQRQTTGLINVAENGTTLGGTDRYEICAGCSVIEPFPSE